MICFHFVKKEPMKHVLKINPYFTLCVIPNDKLFFSKALKGNKKVFPKKPRQS